MKKTLTPNEALRFNVQPLYDRHLRLALYISAKAACTTATKWFFHHTGHLREAQKYGRWIHDYRRRVYYTSEEYRSHLSELLKREYTIVKVVRNPFDRVVSSFIHAMKHNLDQRPMQRVVSGMPNSDAALWKSRLAMRMARRVFGKKRRPGRFTFREFLYYLWHEGVDHGDVHFRTQWHPLESFAPVTHVIPIDDLSRGLRNVEAQLGLAPTDIGSFSSSIHHTHRSNQKGAFAADTRFKVFKRNDVVVPACHDFYDFELAQLVADLYKIDFQTYGYDPSPECVVNQRREIVNDRRRAG